MVVDRARNTLRQARKLAAGDSVRDFVGRRDRDDLYRIRLGSRSQFSLQIGNVQRGAKVRAEVFSLKGSIGRIGRINFSNLTRKQRQNLTRLGASSTTINRTLEAGQYYLRLSPQRGESRYRLTVNATPISAPTPPPTSAPLNPISSWIRQFGTGGNDYAYGAAIDSSGNLYVSGTFANGSTTDAFVAKYDPNGNRTWLRSFGSNDSDTAFDVAVDAQGNYYVAGATNVRLNFLSPNSDGFIAKYDANGNQLWRQTIESNRLDAASSVAIDAAGNAYISGFTKAFPTGGEESQAFVAKYSTTGQREWLTEYGSGAADAAADVALDAAGNVYITGIHNADLATDPDQPFTGGDAFVAKFNNGGVRQWDQFLTSSGGQDYGRSIAVTANGTIYITGQTDGTLPGQTSAGGRDGFIARYSTDGALGWVRQFGTSSLDEGQSIAIAPDSSIYVSGETDRSLFGQTAFGGTDAFFAQFNANGDRLSAQQIGTNRNDESYNLRFDAAGNLYVIGQTEGAFSGQTSAGAYDAWVAKYTP